MTNRPSVVLWAFMCHPEWGGEGGLGWNWAHAYVRHGYDVHLVTGSTHRAALEQALADQPNGPPIHPLFVDVSKRAFNRGQSENIGFVYDYLAWQKDALRTCRDHGLDSADLKHHLSLGTLLGGSQLSRLASPVVFGPVGGGDVSAPELRHMLGRRRFRDTVRTATIQHLTPLLPTVRSTVPKTDLMLAANTDTERLVRRLGARNVELMMPDGVNQSLLASGNRAPQDDREPIVLWVARFLPRKAPALAVQAFQHVHQRLPHARLVMVGDGPVLQETQQLAEDLRLRNRVDFMGLLDWPSVVRLYDQASVFLFTSIRDTTSATAIEAAARALPMVTIIHSGGGGCERYPDTGACKVFAHPTGTLPARMATAIIDVLTDDHGYAGRSAAMLHFARHNTWDAKVGTVEHRARTLDWAR